MKSYKAGIFAVSLALVAFSLSACATPGDWARGIAGTSTTELRDARDTALKKAFNYDYNTCYLKMEAILKKMPHVSMYARESGLIAVDYIHPNTTAVGVFITPIDKSRTQVAVSSLSTPSKEWVARNLFAETALPAEALFAKGDDPATAKIGQK